MSDPLFEEALRLIEHMQDSFSESDQAMADLLLEQSALTSSHHTDPIVMELLQEVKDSIGMLALRASQVRLLYASKLAEAKTEYAQAASLQQQARLILSQAEIIVAQREQAYRVPWQRIGSWRENPTVYRYTPVVICYSAFFWAHEPHECICLKYMIGLDISGLYIAFTIGGEIKVELRFLPSQYIYH